MCMWDRDTAADPVSAQKLNNQPVDWAPIGNVVKKVKLMQW